MLDSVLLQKEHCAHVSINAWVWKSKKRGEVAISQACMCVERGGETSDRG